MINFASYFSRSIKNTLRVKNGVNFSYAGPWVAAHPNTVVDEWFVGDFMAAEYTIVADLGPNDKEMIKCLIVAGPDTANVTVYGRTNLGRNIVEVSAAVNASKLQLIVDPAVFDNSTVGVGAKVIFSATYYKTLNDLGA